MPIRKPVPATIRADDFRDKAYRFTIESVLGPDENPGLVVVSVSPGYLITTSQVSQPKREQLFRYNQQADGSWVVDETVTLLPTQDVLVNGAVIIWDSNSKTVVLTVDITSTSIERWRPATLANIPSTLTFPVTSSGQPSFQVLTVAQPYSDEPVTISTDEPDYFQLASDRHPSFSPTLTLQPSSDGSYVHIRYISNRRVNRALLTIHSIHGDETIALLGSKAGLLPARLNPTASSEISHPAQPMKWVAGILISLLVIGLTFAGYQYRYQLFPTLFKKTTADQPADKSSSATVGVTDRTEVPRQVAPTQSVNLSNKKSTPGVTSVQSASRTNEERRTRGDGSNERTRRKAASQTVNEESDLERELNRSDQ